MKLLSSKKSLSKHAARLLALASLFSAVAAWAQPADNANGGIDISEIKAELEQSRKATSGNDAQNANIQKEFQRLMAAEAELLNKMTNQAGNNTPVPTAKALNKATAPVAPDTRSDTRASADMDRAIDTLTQPSEDELIAANQMEAQKRAAIAAVKPAKGASVQAKAAINEEAPSREELNDLKMVEPADLQASEKMESQTKNIEKLEKQNAELRQQLDAARRNARETTKELEETRNRLIIAETQVERLSSVIEERNKSSLSRYNPAQAQPAKQVAAVTQQAPMRTYQQVRPKAVEKPADEMPVATVIADKAHLRTGPGKDNSPLMTVTKGTRLAVETRNGDWYRVVSPTGARAWVSSDVLAFGSSSSNSAQVKGYNSGTEDEASKLIAPNEQ